MTMRVGLGFDQHPLVSGRPLVLGGVVIPFELGLDGHSDADVLLHALVDALLGAAALGDLGEHFPASDPKWKGASSKLFLEAVMRLLAERGFRVGNVDATILAARPRLAPHVAILRASVAQLLQIEIDCVSIKAKSANGLGAIGRGEGIACHAVAMIIPSASGPPSRAPS
jgi:2-C-methyl-D-erythritol 2,4-cyclodiphosphate synthase